MKLIMSGLTSSCVSQFNIIWGLAFSHVVWVMKDGSLVIITIVVTNLLGSLELHLWLLAPKQISNTESQWSLVYFERE